MTLSTFKLGTKLGAAFAILVAIALAMGSFAIGQLAVINRSAEDLAINWLPSIKQAATIRNVANQIRRAEADHVMSIDDRDMAAIEQKLTQSRERLSSEMNVYAPLISSAAERMKFDSLRGHVDSYLKLQSQLLAVSRGGEKTMEQAKSMFRGDSEQAFNAIAKDLTDLVQVNDEGSQASRQMAKAAYASARVWVITLNVLGALMAVALGVVVTRLITRPLAIAVDAAEKIAAGDLSVRVEASGRDETAQLLTALGDMQDKLGKIVSEVRENADGVATASAQIAQGNLDLSSRTEQQASALEETAASMEQLTSTIGQTADNTRVAGQLAASANSNAERGGQVVAQVVSTMQEINASSKQISEIIGTIDSIAFQTNILALNAAVEAARAGEQGRGFAVVATEVRTLAHRSAEAARQIKLLIGASVERVEQGSALVTEAGASMHEILASIKRVATVMHEISTATAEQSSGVAQVDEAVSHMDQATQQNAALVEESAAAAESLRSQAQRLVDTVSVFRLASRRT